MELITDDIFGCDIPVHSLVNRFVKYIEEFGEPYLANQKVERDINKGQDFMIGLNMDPLSVEPPKAH